MERGKLIVLEGPDGSGKSTHSKLLAEHLRSEGHDVVTTQEPTKGFIGKEIRKVLSGEVELTARALTLLFTADRAEHVASIIEPALVAGKTVITDRYYYSTVAYQSVQGVDRDWISDLNSFVPEPDLVLILKVPTKEAMDRMNGREMEVFEVADFQEKVQEELLFLAKGDYKRLSRPGRMWKIIDTSGSREDIQKEIMKEASKIV